MERISKKRKLFVSLSVVVVVAVLGVFGTFAAFTATTTNTGNSISSGTVNVAQHAGFTTLYNLTAQKPGVAATRCVRVTYTGSLAATIKLYATGPFTNGGDYTLTVNRGQSLTAPAADMNCTGFATQGTIYNGDLGAFATTYAAGLATEGGAAWNNGTTEDYQFIVTVKDDATPGAHTTARTSGTHAFTWEAQNN